MTAPSGPPSGAAEPRPTEYVGLLTQVMTNTLDADYEQLAARSEPDRPTGSAASRRPLAVVAVFTAFGLMVGVSALQTEQERPQEAAERAELVDQIHQRQDRLNALHNEQTALQDDVTRLQQTLADDVNHDQQLSGQLTELGVDAGALAVTGPGVSITVDDAPSSSGLGGVILDTDLQVLANGLWQAGAEAIAIDGHRLTSLTSIRFAGEAITVDYRSLAPPYSIEATGDPDTLAARLLQTAGGQYLLSLKTHYGVEFDVATKDKLVLPSDPHDHLTYASAPGSNS